MSHPRGAYVLNALMMVSSHTRCRAFANFVVGSVVLRFFRVQLSRLIIPFPSFVRATFRARDCFPEFAYESDNRVRERARLNATAYINIGRIIIREVRSCVMVQSTMKVGCKRSNATRIRKGSSYVFQRACVRVVTSRNRLTLKELDCCDTTS